MDDPKQRAGICVSCWLEFDIDDPEVTIVTEPAYGKCLVLFSGRAHSLILGRDWETVRRRIDRENHALKPLALGYEKDEVDGEAFDDAEEEHIEDLDINNIQDDSTCF
jgi:hypothetical protein